MTFMPSSQHNYRAFKPLPHMSGLWRWKLLWFCEPTSQDKLRMKTWSFGVTGCTNFDQAVHHASICNRVRFLFSTVPISPSVCLESCLRVYLKKACALRDLDFSAIFANSILFLIHVLQPRHMRNIQNRHLDTFFCACFVRAIRFIKWR